MLNLVPKFIIRNLREKKFKGRFKGNALFLDIAGFTPMTEALQRHGKEGAEVLSSMLNRIFNPLIEKVYYHGGFITGFAGDAFTAIFPNRASGDALLAAQEMQKIFSSNSVQTTRFGEFDLAAKCGLSHGSVHWGIVGGRNRKSYFFKGSAIEGTVEAEKNCSNGEIVLTKSFYENLPKGICEVDERKGCYLLRSLKIVKREKKTFVKGVRTSKKALSLFHPREALNLGFTGEFREVVSIFVSFDDIRDFEELNRFVAFVHEKAALFGGYFSRLAFGDKGPTLLCLFGAPVSHEKNVQRAADFCLALKSNPFTTVRTGMTYGTVYAGVMGSKRRCEYTVLGDAVNLSARYMSSAEDGEILISEPVVQKAEQDFNISRKGLFKLKGKSVEVETFAFDDRKHIRRDLAFEGSMAGREKELQLASSCCDVVREGSFGGVLYVYGDAGMGKSRLMYELAKKEDNIKILMLKCDGVLKTSLNPFEYLVRDYFSVIESRTAAENKTEFEANWGQLLEVLSIVVEGYEGEQLTSELERLKSMIGSLGGIHWEDSLYEQLDGRTRFMNIVSGVGNLIKAETRLQPVMLVFEDLQWMDADSQSAVQQLYDHLSGVPVLVVALSRRNDDGSKPVIAFPPGVKTEEIDLSRLSHNAVGAMAKEILNGDPDEDLLNFIESRTQGTPFYVEQFCSYLAENSMIAERGEELSLSGSSSDVPDGIKPVLVARIDRLSNDIKEMVRTASVLGNEFDMQILSEMLKGIEVNPLLEVGESERLWTALSEVMYIFSHALLRDTVYEMQLKNRLRKLHCLAAESFEKLHGDEPSNYANLAYHYEHAEIKDKAKEYLLKAADHAAESYRNREILDLQQRYCRLSEGKEYFEGKLKTIRTMNILGRFSEIPDLIKECLTELPHDLKEEFEGRFVLEESLCLQDLSNLDGALEKGLKAFEMLKRSFPGNNRWVAESNNNLGVLYKIVSKTDESIKYHDMALKMRVDLFGEENEAVGRSHGNIAMLHLGKNNFEKAVEHSEKAMAIFKSSFGEGHPDVGSVYGNLGLIFKRQGDNKRAVESYRKSLDIYSRVMGSSHPLLTVIFNNIALILMNDEKYDEAIEYLNKGVTNTKRKFGENHGNLAACYSNIGLIWQSKREYDKALRYFLKTIKIVERVMSGNKRFLYMSYTNTGLTLTDLERYEESLEYHLKSHEILEELFQYKDPITANEDFYIARTLYNLKRYEEALSYAETAVKYGRKFKTDWLDDAEKIRKEINRKL